MVTDFISSLSTPLRMGLLALIALVMALPGFFHLPPVDRDETRFAQASRQMVQTGDLVDIRFQDGTRYKKPIGIYWAQMLTASLVGVDAANADKNPIWAYRLPSLIGFVLAVIGTFWLASMFLGPTWAFVAALLLAVSVLPGFEARIAKTDALLLAVIVFAQGVIGRAWLQGERPISWGYFALLWGMIGLGILIKGPIILLVSALTVTALCTYDWSFRTLRAIRPLFGLLLTIAIAAPWFIAIGIKSEGAFFIEAGLVDFLAKVTNVKESHGGPPGIYAAIMIGTFWPASLFFLASLPLLWKHRREKAIAFAFCWVAPSWVVFELTSTKLPHYVLPLYPGLALAATAALVKGMPFAGKWRTPFFALFFVLPAILVCVAVGGVFYFEGEIAVFAILSGVLSVGAAFLWWWRVKAGGVFMETRTFAAFLAAPFLLYCAVYQFSFPALKTIWLSDGITALVNKVEFQSTCPAPRVFSVGYAEPSLAFLGPLDLRYGSVEEAVALSKEASCRHLIVEKRFEARVRYGLASEGLTLAPKGNVEGLALNGGDDMSLTLYAIQPNEQAD